MRICTFSALAALLLLINQGCERKIYDPAWATRPYPHDMHRAMTVDMQVFRRDTDIEIVNSTARSYADFDIWVNQRYVRHVNSLPAGGTIKLSLWEFHDDLGDAFYAGGLFRTYEPTPVRLVEIQPTPDQPMVGLVTIRKEEFSLKSNSGR
jgi:hypothetical protein